MKMRKWECGLRKRIEKQEVSELFLVKSVLGKNCPKRLCRAGLPAGRDDRDYPNDKTMTYANQATFVPKPF
jgi:hypothetical protein